MPNFLSLLFLFTKLASFAKLHVLTLSCTNNDNHRTTAYWRDASHARSLCARGEDLPSISSERYIKPSYNPDYCWKYSSHPWSVWKHWCTTGGLSAPCSGEPCDPISCSRYLYSSFSPPTVFSGTGSSCIASNSCVGTLGCQERYCKPPSNQNLPPFTL